MIEVSKIMLVLVMFGTSADGTQNIKTSHSITPYETHEACEKDLAMMKRYYTGEGYQIMFGECTEYIEED